MYRTAARLLAIVIALTFGLLAGSSAMAAGNPDMQLDSRAGNPLFGVSSPVTATASLAAGQPNGYNLSYRVVLPAGISYDGGSSIQPDVITDAPNPGETTLLFINVSDLIANSSQSLEFDVSHDPNLYEVGDQYGISYEAFLNSDPRYVPHFNQLGEPEPDSYTGSAASYTTSMISAIRVGKSEPSPEGEILRGVHNHQTVYTLTLENNAINPVESTTIDDYLPAGLEFLGCEGDADNTTNAPSNPGSAEEYPGSGPIEVGAVDDCHAPVLVETVKLDPDGPGPLPEAVYTHVHWETGTLAPGEVVTYRYRAAVPLRENTLDWSGPEPAVTGAQAANLDNNSGPETRDEQKLTNFAAGNGIYKGENGDQAVDSETSLTRTAEDLAVVKSVDHGALEQGADSTWTLRFRTGEYRYSDDIVVTDTLPNGLCPLGPVNYTTGNDGSDSECDPTGADPSAPYTGVTENADGTFTIKWDKTTFPQLGHTDVSDGFVITFPTRTRSHYQSNFLPTTPILAKDSVSNKVSLTGEASSRCVNPGTPDCATEGPIIWSDGDQPRPVIDDSAAGQAAAAPTILKEVAGSGTDCEAATYGSTVPKYHPGDRVCWRLTVDFPAKVHTGELGVNDFLPAGVVYDAGSVRDTAANTTTNTLDDSKAGAGLLNWEIDGHLVPVGGQKFQVTFSTTVQPAGLISPVDVKGNLQKFGFQNTDGRAFPLRDLAAFEQVLPQIGIKKGVRQVNSGTVHSPPVDGLTARGGDSVTYQVDVNSTEDTKEVQVWDRLPAAYGCAMVSAISNSGICSAGVGSDPDYIKWTIPAIEDGDTTSFTYRVLIPGSFGPENTYTNTAGVRQYQADTNTGGRYIYTPQNNIDPDNPRTPNVARVDDPSQVKTPKVGVEKSRTTSIDEPGNSASSQATIGEIINYMVKVTLPSGTTFGTDAKITDTPDSATTQPVTGAPTALLDGSPLPAGWSINTTGQTVTVNIPDSHVVPVGSDSVVTIQMATKVADVAANVRGANRANQAKVSWKDGSVRSRSSNRVTTRIVEPHLVQGKTNDVDPGSALPGQTVTYTLATRNGNTGNVSVAHDTVIQDVVPAGVTLVDGGGNPIADGGVVPGTGNSIWDATARTITSPPLTLDPNTDVVWTYEATIDEPAVGGSKYRNTAEARTSSISGDSPDERTADSPTNAGYRVSSESTVKVAGTAVTKSVNPDWVTIGSPVAYTVKLTIPKKLDFFNLTATDVLPDSLDFDGYVSSSCISGCSTSNPAPTVRNYSPVVKPAATTIGWDLGEVTAGTHDQVVEFIYRAHVRDTHRQDGTPVKAGQNVVNSVHSFSNLTHRWDFDADTLRPPSSYDYESPRAKTTTPVREPELTLDKRIQTDGGAFVNGPVQSQPGDSLTYSIVVTNSGSSAAWDVTVKDMPDAELTNVVLAQGAGFNTKAWSSGDRAMKWLIPGPIAPGDSVTLTYTADVIDSTGLRNGDSAINTAGSDYFGLPESDRTNPWDYRDYSSNDDRVRVDFEFPEISVDKTTTGPGFPDIADADLGQPFGWRIVIKNNADTATALDPILRDTLPPHWTYDAGSAAISGAATAEPSVAASPAGDVLTWDFNGQSIEPGASVVITFTATPQPDARANPPVQINNAAAKAKDAGGNSGNADGPYTDDDDARATLKFPIADLKITKSAPATVNSQDEFNYTLLVENKGPDGATNVVIDDPLPASLVFVSSADCNAASVCELGSMATGESKTVVIRVKATYAAAGTTVVNTATVTGDQWEPTPEDNTDTVKTEVLGEADVKITKIAAPSDARPGGMITYSLKAENIGTAIADNVVITDALPVGLTFVSADVPCGETAGTVTCEIGSLAPGEEKTYVVKVTVDPWGDADPAANHLLDVQKVETQIDLDPGQKRTVQATCPGGYFASDGSVRIDYIDQGTGDWPTQRILESRASSVDTWQGTVENTANGRAQAKIFAVCIKLSTADEGGHSHDLILSDPITVSHVALAGKDEAILPCGPGQVAVQPGFVSSAPGDLGYSQPEGNGWKFVLDLDAPAEVTYSIRCMTRQVSLEEGHTHDLALKRIWTEQTIEPGKVHEVQLTCPDGSKGIVGGWDLDPGLVSLGNDPRPVTRAFKVYNPTDEPLEARFSLLCLGDRTGGEHLPPKEITNTAYISTTSIEIQTDNNISSATVTAEDTDNHDPVGDGDGKPPVNNETGDGRPPAGNGAKKGLRVAVRGPLKFMRGRLFGTVRSNRTGRGVARLVTTRNVRVRGKRFARGTTLARGRGFVRAGRYARIRLRVTGAGQRIFRQKRAMRGKLRFANAPARLVRIRR